MIYQEVFLWFRHDITDCLGVALFQSSMQFIAAAIKAAVLVVIIVVLLVLEYGLFEVLNNLS